MVRTQKVSEARANVNLSVKVRSKVNLLLRWSACVLQRMCERWKHTFMHAFEFLTFLYVCITNVHAYDL